MAKSAAARRAAEKTAEDQMTVRQRSAARREREQRLMYAIFGSVRERNKMNIPPFLFTAYKPPVIALVVKGADVHAYGVTATYLPTGIEYSAIMIEYAKDTNADDVLDAVRVRHAHHGLSYDATGALCLALLNKQPNSDGNLIAVLLHGPEDELRTMYRAVKVKPAAEART